MRLRIAIGSAGVLFGMALLIGCAPQKVGGPVLSASRGAPMPPMIVFSSNRAGPGTDGQTGPWRIWAIKPDGSQMKPLTEGTADDLDVDPVFSPDGASILFTSTRGGKGGIWRAPLEAGRSGSLPSAGKPERLCDGDQGEWSPDGKKIVLRRGERIVVRDLLSGKEKVVTPDDFPHCSGPAWSPDGNTVAFACRWDAGNGVFTVPVQGGKPVKVYDKQGACEPHWSPDGARIVYETETNICTINPDGTKNRMVTYYGGVQRYARFSPDGKSLVFCQAASPQGPWELYVVSVGGGEPTRLTEGGSDMYPDWK